MEYCKKCNKDCKQTGLLHKIPMLDGWYCEPCFSTGYQLTVEEAEAFAKSGGYRIQHKYYTEEEYLKWEDGWITEDGYELAYPFISPFHNSWNAIPNKPLT